MNTIDPFAFKKIVFFTGAGMSQESGIPTYRGKGGVWSQYNYRDYACQDAFDRNPDKVYEFHEVRRKAIMACEPHGGHVAISALEKKHPGVWVVTQNIDGMHQRAGSSRVVELHGSIFKARCPVHGSYEDIGGEYRRKTCETCGAPLRPAIVWFGDMLDQAVIETALSLISTCDLFISIGTSALVWPAAGFPEYAQRNSARTLEINPEATGLSTLYDTVIREKASTALEHLFEKAP
jgi:NAD-dependent deacetylase